jgi:hypothetical protein
MCCSYCAAPATLRIVSTRDEVCLEHALEFWAGLLAYVRDRPDLCVKHKESCSCRACERLSAAQLRAIAIAAAGQPPRDGERLPIRLAS